MAALQRQAVDLIGSLRLGQHPGGRRGSDQFGQPRDPAALFVDADRQRQRGADAQVFDQVGPSIDMSVQLPMKMPPT